jgi:hypothetical protein
MWTLTGEQDDDWFLGTAGFAIDSDHSILIEAKIRQNGEGDIGIDDISITNGYCPTSPTFAVPEGGLTTATPAMTSKMFV